MHDISYITDPEAYTERPSRCVFMTDLAQTLEGQTWLDMDCLEQVSIC